MKFPEVSSQLTEVNCSLLFPWAIEFRCFSYLDWSLAVESGVLDALLSLSVWRMVYADEIVMCNACNNDDGTVYGVGSDVGTKTRDDRAMAVDIVLLLVVDRI